MLDSFLIENFRLFSCLELTHLGRVNLLVGKNNSGKSAFLEALAVYASNVSKATLRDLLSDREETWNEDRQPESQAGSEAVRHLFHGHRIPAVGSSGMVVGPIGNISDQLHLITRTFEIIYDDKGDAYRRMLDPGQLADEFSARSYETVLVAENGDRPRLLFVLDQIPNAPATVTFGDRVAPRCPFQRVPTSSIGAEAVARLWDRIGLAPQADEVLDGLRLMVPAISGILFIQPGDAKTTPVSCPGEGAVGTSCSRLRLS